MSPKNAPKILTKWFRKDYWSILGMLRFCLIHTPFQKSKYMSKRNRVNNTFSYVYYIYAAENKRKLYLTEIFWNLLIKINENENRLKNLHKLKNLSGKKKEINAGLTETYSKITFTTNSTFANIILVLKKHGKISSCKY